MKNKNKHSIVYNPDHEYGANQRSPILTFQNDSEEYHQLYNIVKMHFPQMTDEQIQAYLEKLNQEGCGYVAMINSLFHAYIDFPELFEDIFGFPMYDEDGSLNYNQVLVDLYCKEDNHNYFDLFFFTLEYISKYEDSSRIYDPDTKSYKTDDTPYGNTQKQIKYRWESYCKEYGIDVDVKINCNINFQNYETYAKKGQITLCCRDFIIHDNMGKSTHIKNGHFMTVTGITEHDEYIVSSWGKKYYLNPKDIKEYLQFQLVVYRNIS